MVSVNLTVLRMADRTLRFCAACSRSAGMIFLRVNLVTAGAFVPVLRLVALLYLEAVTELIRSLDIFYLLNGKRCVGKGCRVGGKLVKRAA